MSLRGSLSVSILAAFFSVQAANAQETQPAMPTKSRIDKKSGLTFVRVPKGSYRELPSLPAKPDEEHDHAVTVGPMWMGMTDVTVSAYAKCAEAQACSASPSARDEAKPRCAWKNGLLTHPMNCVSWAEAAQFCKWIKGRLPTAAEWEYAATSGQFGKPYPWGDAPPDGSHANYCDVNCPKALGEDGKNLARWEKEGWIDRDQNDGWAATSPAGSYPAGTTPWGLLDMAGNVWQWTSSPAGDGKHEVRGGSWDNPAKALQTSKRLAWADRPDAGMGFRCVKD